MVNRASAPHSGLSVERQRGWPPPPHSSENRTLVPSLLKVAECQNDMLASPAISIRYGLAASLISSSRPSPAQAPPARPTSGYTEMSWHWFGPVGVAGVAGTLPGPPAAACAP